MNIDRRLRMILVSTIIPILLVNFLNPLEGLRSEENPPDRGTSKSYLVIIENITVDSGGISQWGYHNYGILNETTRITVFLMNNKIDAPIKDIKLNMTIYWHGGIGFDTQRTMHRDSKSVLIPGGKGTFSDPQVFNWTPRFAGSYLINISVKVPGDTYPISDSAYIQGETLELGDGSTFTTGVWVGTQYWTCSEMDGWTSESTGGIPGMGWHVSDHPISKRYPSQHTTDGVFWVGNETSGNSPKSGIYSLISPWIDLDIFDPNPTNPSIEGKGPKIYFLYKYEGNISPMGPAGIGGLKHEIQIWGDSWQTLKNSYDEPIFINDNDTDITDPIWNYPSRDLPSLISGPLPGIDLGDFQGKKVRIKISYIPSGKDEIGYMLDDFSVVGLQRVEFDPYVMGDHTTEITEVIPGEGANFNMEILRGDMEEDVRIRSACVNASDGIDINRDVRIDPEVFIINGGVSSYGVTVEFNARPNLKAGPAFISIRIIGAGKISQIDFQMVILTKFQLHSSISGHINGDIISDEDVEVSLRIENRGNSKERIDYRFISRDGLIWSRASTSYQLGPAESVMVDGRIRVENGTMAGGLNGYFLVGKEVLDHDTDELFERIYNKTLEKGWRLHEVGYQLIQDYMIEIRSSNTIKSVDNPPENGTEVLSFELTAINYGNGLDKLNFSQEGLEEGFNISIELPQSVSLEPLVPSSIKIPITLRYPVPLGEYEFTVTCQSSGEEDEISDNEVDFALIVGKDPLSRGVYLVEDSMTIEPKESILGLESIITFEAKSFGIKHQSPFTVMLSVDGNDVMENEFYTSGSGDSQYNIIWKFKDKGSHNITIYLPEHLWSQPPGGGLNSSLSSTILVKFIEIELLKIYLDDDAGEIGSEKIDPGEYTIFLEVKNNGDRNSQPVDFELNLTDLSTGKSISRITSIPVVYTNGTTIVNFQDLPFLESRSYRIKVELVSDHGWEEINEENNFITEEQEVGSKPTEKPLWRHTTFVVISLVILVIITTVLFFYLISRKNR